MKANAKRLIHQRKGLKIKKTQKRVKKSEKIGHENEERNPTKMGKNL